MRGYIMSIINDDVLLIWGIIAAVIIVSILSVSFYRRLKNN